MQLLQRTRFVRGIRPWPNLSLAIPSVQWNPGMLVNFAQVFEDLTQCPIRELPVFSISTLAQFGR